MAMRGAFEGSEGDAASASLSRQLGKFEGDFGFMNWKCAALGNHVIVKGVDGFVCVP